MSDRIGTSDARPGGSSSDGGRRAERAAWFADRFAALQRNVETFIKGKTEVVHLALMCVLAEGHLLIEDVPGVGKTMLARSIANSIKGSFSRIQFTPDLLPSDCSGTLVYKPSDQTFEPRFGPVFANIVLADEINRASPKTQSALLEVMEERQVTMDGTSYQVPEPFTVIATMNTIEDAGTYVLPAAELDRFTLHTTIGYMQHRPEVEMLQDRVAGRRVEDVRPVMDLQTVQTMSAISRQTHVAPAVMDYVVGVCASTRRLPQLRLGASPRASVCLVRVAQTFAAAQGQEFVTADHVKAVAGPVLAFRLLLTAEAELNGDTGASIVSQILASVPVPDERVG